LVDHCPLEERLANYDKIDPPAAKGLLGLGYSEEEVGEFLGLTLERLRKVSSDS
jgi:hypothetical protein